MTIEISLKHRIVFSQPRRRLHLEDLKPYMYGRVRPRHALVERVAPSSNQSRYPMTEDTLFWAVYYHVHAQQDGAAATMPLHRLKLCEIEEKQKIIEYLKQHPGCLKPMKITKVATKEMMGELSTQKKVTLFSLHAVACVYQCNVVVVFERQRRYLVYETTTQDTTDEVPPPLVVVQDSHNAERYRIAPTEYSYTHFLRQVSYDKILHGMSHYTLADLFLVAEQLGLDLPTTKVKKEDLYRRCLGMSPQNDADA